MLNLSPFSFDKRITIFLRIYNFSSWIFKILWKSIFLETALCNSEHSETSSWVMVSPTQIWAQSVHAHHHPHHHVYLTHTNRQEKFTGWVKEKCELRRLVQNCTFFCATLLYGVFQKKSANLFFLKIKCLEKQKCVYTLFLSNSKVW